MTLHSLACRGISVAFGGNQVLTDVTLNAEPGFTGLIGPNGAGKTTLFNVITGYVQPMSGEVRLGDWSLDKQGPAKIAKMGVARTFQTPKLIQDMTVLENALLGVDGRRRLSEWRPLFGTPKCEREMKEQALDALGQFGLRDYAGAPVSSMPLGMQKLVEVVRALLSRPRLLLLDEPAAGVSASDVARMIEPLKEWVSDADLCVVIVEHDLELVSTLCKNVLVIDFGRVIAYGAPQDVTRHPEVVTAYLGASFATERA